jgi:hypothetical protein
MMADRRSQVSGRVIGRAFAVGALFAAAFALAGCSTSIADLPVGGTAADAQAPHEPGTYLPVHDLPPDRNEAVISPAERAKIQTELTKARDRQATATAAATPATAPAAAKDLSPPKPARRTKSASDSQAED